ncbi:MAG: hypothetical protein ACXAEU_11355 [Candidatus Hodarchaeales archaeon]|jgi:F0F1-type ATP synthase membrane subunit b/b'
MIVSFNETEKKIYAVLLSKNSPLSQNEIAKAAGLKSEEVEPAIKSFLGRKILRVLQEEGFPDLFFPTPLYSIIQQSVGTGYTNVEKTLDGTSKQLESLKEELFSSLTTLYSEVTSIPSNIEKILGDYNGIFKERTTDLISSKSDQYKNTLVGLTEMGLQSIKDNRKALQERLTESKDTMTRELTKSVSELDENTMQVIRLLTEYQTEFDGIIHDTVKHFEEALRSASSSINEVILNLEKGLTTNLRHSFTNQTDAQQAVLESMQKTLEEDISTASSNLEEAKKRVKSLQERVDNEISTSLASLKQQLETVTEDKKEDIYQFLDSRIKEIGKEIGEKISAVQENSKIQLNEHLKNINEAKEQLTTLSTTSFPSTVEDFTNNVLKQSKVVYQSLNVEIEKNLRLFEGMAIDFIEDSRKNAKGSVEDFLGQSTKVVNESIDFLENEFKDIERSARDWKKTAATVQSQLEDLETTVKKRVEQFETSSHDLTDNHKNRLKEVFDGLNKNFETGIQEEITKTREKFSSTLENLKTENITKYESNIKTLDEVQREIVAIKDGLTSKFREKTEKQNELLKSELDVTTEGIKGSFQELMTKFKDEFSSIRSNSSIKLSESESNFISLSNTTKNDVKAKVLTAKSALSDSLKPLPEKISEALDNALEVIRKAFEEVKKDVGTTVAEGLKRSSDEFDNLTGGFDTLLDNLSSTSSGYLKEYTENVALISAESESGLVNIFDEKQNNLDDILTRHTELHTNLTSSTGDRLDNYLEKVILKTNETSNSIGESLSEFSSIQDSSFTQISQETTTILSNVEQNANNALELTKSVNKEFNSQLGVFKQEIADLKARNLEQIGDKISKSDKAVEAEIGSLSIRTSDKFTRAMKDTRTKLEETNNTFIEEMRSNLEVMDGSLIFVHDQGRQSIEKSLDAQKEIGKDFSSKMQETAKNSTDTLAEQLSVIVTSTSGTLSKTTKMTQDDSENVLNSIKEEAQSIITLLDEDHISKIKDNNLIMINTLMTEVQSHLDQLRGQFDTSIANLGSDVINTLQEVSDSHDAINDDAAEKITAISKNFATQLSKREEKSVSTIRDNAKKLSQPVEILVEMMSVKSTEEIKPFITKIQERKDDINTLLRESKDKTSTLLKQSQENAVKVLDQLKDELQDEDKTASKLVGEVAKQTGDFFEKEIDMAISLQLEENREKILIDSTARIQVTKEATEKWKNESQQVIGKTFQECENGLSKLLSDFITEGKNVEESIASIEEFSLKVDPAALATIRQMTSPKDFEIYADGFFKRTKESLIVLATDMNDTPLDFIKKLGTKIRVRIFTILDVSKDKDKNWTTDVFNARTGTTVYSLPSVLTPSARSIAIIRDNAEILLSLTGDDERFTGMTSSNTEVVDVFNQLLAKLALQGSKRVTKKQVF